MRMRRVILLSVTVLYLAALVCATFMPNSAASRSQWFWPVIAFLPVGVLLVLLLGRRRWWAAFGFSVLAAVWIEAAQSAWMPVGYANLSDVALSSMGALAGVAIATMLSAPRSRSPRAHGSPRVVTQTDSREIPQD
ncbi:VanZ family protein [Salinibacterium sp.]|uniref:VanZ family protein n=2 Tax=Salinibacterium sp. TaxID=1915057 RepID=UPI00286D467B|nr:VanZ family protein [Salinibacterium sp.]